MELALIRAGIKCRRRDRNLVEQLAAGAGK